MTLDEVRQLPAVLSVEEAGRVIGLKRSAAYDAAKRGELPVVAFGRRLVVPTAKLLALLGVEQREQEADARARPA
jgi:excisionase family DNA binding protein